MEKRKIEEASDACGVPYQMILRFIEEEWIRPSNSDGPLLDEEDIARIHFIWELYEDFGVNDEAVPIILHLVDQLNRIHLELKKFQIH